MYRCCSGGGSHKVLKSIAKTKIKTKIKIKTKTKTKTKTKRGWKNATLSNGIGVAVVVDPAKC